MWYKYSTEYYSSVKKNEIMNIIGKWMENRNDQAKQDKILLSEVT